ncbi:fatty acid desaturase family protein [Pendulispora albinea]|uniref:Fatty acid desaturase n=1 Tax=Pendulispora albinea TaxID=2741071 RepID=A0ABZ2M6D3_9BACT
MEYIVTNGESIPQGNLEGDVDVPLAFIAGKDKRRALPREMFQRMPVVFLTKFFFALGIIATATAAIAWKPTGPVIAVAILVNGLIFAHLVELQHECMHNHAFRSPKLNRLFGVLCGVFMMSSHSHYRYDHLRHHAYLGTKINMEHFRYRFQNLNSIFGFTRAFFDPSRFGRVAGILWRALLRRPIPGIEKEKYDRDIKNEYIFYFVLLLASIAYTAYSGSWLPLLAWWAPALLVAEGVHFLIEMPEHFGLNTQTQQDVLSNTRTIRTSAIVTWFVNGNNLHTAHHYHHGVPMCNIKKLHAMMEKDIKVFEPSYRSLYRAILAGKIKHAPDETCMER